MHKLSTSRHNFVSYHTFVKEIPSRPEKKVLENYNLYKEFLEKEGWWTPEYYKFAGKDLSSLYGNLYDDKNNLIYTININVHKVDASKTSTTTPAMASEVSISLLTKKK